MTFRLSGIDPAAFEPLFALGDDALRRVNARRVVADGDAGFPCRVSLQDAARGDTLLLLPYQHQPAASPYRASGPIFVRRGAARAVLAPGEVPAYVAKRLISLRAYDGDGMMVDADVREGNEVADALVRMFRDPAVADIHLHNARRGCFSCVARRA